MGRGGYGNVEFWDDYYVTDRPEPYDWFFSAKHLTPLLKLILRPSDEILMVGCGNAPFSEELYALGYDRQVNNDNCELVVLQMRQRAPHMVWDVEDVRAMSYPADRFDVIFDKGLLDNLYCYRDPEENCQRAVADMYRVLKPGGCFIVLSCHDEDEVEGSLRASPQRVWEEGPGSRLLLRLRNPRFPATRIASYTMLCLTKARARAVESLPETTATGGAAAASSAAPAAGMPPYPPTAAGSPQLPTDQDETSALFSLLSPEDGGRLLLREEEVVELKQQVEELLAVSRRDLLARQDALCLQQQQYRQQQQQQKVGTNAFSTPAAASPPNGTFSEQLSLRRQSLRAAPPLPPTPPLTMECPTETEISANASVGGAGGGVDV